jgi:ATP-dependent protease ClpP protease subunit
MSKRLYSSLEQEDLRFINPSNISNKKSKKSKVEEEVEDDMPSPEMFELNFDQNAISVRDNHIYFYGKVSTSNCLKLNLAIKDVERKLHITQIDLTADNLKIYLHINSFGGSVFAALSTIDTIQNCNFPIVSIIEGGAASAATMISVICQERVIRSNSFMLIHQLSSGFWGKMEEIKDEFMNLKKLTKKIKKLYKNNTLLNNKDSDIKLNDILKRDLWWDCNECLKYGLVDRIE